MFRFFMVMISLMIFLGCTTKDVEIKKEEILEVKKQIINPWPEDEKSFWTAMLFSQLSHMPGIQQRFFPIHLYRTVQCVIGEYEKKYEFEVWKVEFATKLSGTLPPEQAQIAYQLTYFCSNKQLQIQQQEIHDGILKNFNEKDAI